MKAASCEKIYQMAAIDLISQKLDIFLLKGVYWECCPATLGFYRKDFNSPVQKKKKKEKRKNEKKKKKRQSVVQQLQPFSAQKNRLSITQLCLAFVNKQKIRFGS